MQSIKKYMYYIILIISTFFVFPSIETTAQERNINFEYLIINDGLLQSKINNIFQDSRGFIWISTDGGLNRFDGYNFEIFQHILHDTTGISSNFVQNIQEDSSGNLWIAIRNEVNKYDPVTGRFKKYETPAFTRNGIIRDMVIDRHDNLWMVARSKLFKFNTIIESFTEIDVNIYTNNGSKNPLYMDHLDNLWIGNFDQLIKINVKTGNSGKENQISNYPLTLSSFIVKIFRKDSSNLYIFTKFQVLKFNIDTGEIETVLQNHNLARINDITKVFKNIYWIATDEGLFEWNSDTGQIYQIHANATHQGRLNDFIISSILLDNSNNIWIGTRRSGINFYNPNKNIFKTIDIIDPAGENKFETIVRSITNDNSGKLLVGLQSKGLNIFEFDDREFKMIANNYESKNLINHAWTLGFDDSGNLWVGTRGNGILVYDKNGKQFEHFNKNNDEPFSLTSNSINYIFKDLNSSIWVGTLKGLNKYNKNSNQFVNYNKKSTLENKIDKNIYSINQDSEDNLWFSSTLR